MSTPTGRPPQWSPMSAVLTLPQRVSEARSYLVDAWQRSILYADVMRRRSEQYRAHLADETPHVLDYEAELVWDGRELERPVNYGLVRIVPPEGVTIDPVKRPFVVVDPRAGHGPGIGGFKADSEIGVALKAGHTCYFIGFLPEPVPGQTIEDIVQAEARFIERVIELHPQAEGKPCVVGNCQAGWSIMMVASLHPELFGPIIVAGAPLSYWAGVRGRYPMRYLGGLLGGSWLTALTGDLGHGQWDGALLVQNFENQNPANTLWAKQYNLYAKVDTEAERYLGFERWWGGHVTLNAEEMQFIVDNLFVGNHLASAGIRTSDGLTMDLRNIRSPIVVFCSQGDNITPPQQALGWILDLYDDVDEIRSHGQTIVYCIHEHIGHLGIFVSGGVARKEHDEFAGNIDLIDVLPPGLYEATFEPKSKTSHNPDLVGGEWVMRCEMRTLDDIRALGGNDLADERRFEAAARLSEINLALYRAFARPFVRAIVTAPVAEALRRMSPLRLQYEAFGRHNPLMPLVAKAADRVRRHRRPISPDNHLLALQEAGAEQIERQLERWREFVERLSEQTFLAVYGSPALQAALGIDRETDERPRHPPRSLLHRELVQQRMAELRARMGEGGTREALVRALVYVGIARGRVDERGFAAVKRLREAQPADSRLSLAEFKALVREQSLMVVIDEEAALAAIPALLPRGKAERRAGWDALRQVLEASGELTGEAAERMSLIARIFGVADQRSGAPREPASKPRDRQAAKSAPNARTRRRRAPRRRAQ